MLINVHFIILKNTNTVYKTYKTQPENEFHKRSRPKNPFYEENCTVFDETSRQEE